jgi:predicted TIM-barrel fold metal-dependent hydrolase
MTIIDAHCHFGGDTPEAIGLLETLGVRALNICVAGDDQGTWRRYAAVYRRLAEEHPERYAWCTTFDPPRPNDPDHAERVIAGIEGDYAASAIACKVWRNIGMEVRDADGRFILLDDPRFEPIFAYLERAGRPVFAHIGEPFACWLPLDEANPMREVLRRYPQFHVYGRGLPEHADLMAAWDRVMERHPRLTFIGAHVASMEHDLPALARRLDRRPNLAIDTSARLYGLSLHLPADVRQFFVAYQDRILFGTDIDLEEPQSALASDERERCLAHVRRSVEQGLAFFAGGGPVTLYERSVPGLALPEAVAEKFFRLNARRWVPGL